jgi:hypothetical protein
MASVHKHDELLDYEDDEEIQVAHPAILAPSSAVAPAAAPAGQDGPTSVAGKDAKGSYVGIHATSFRDFLLKPELLRAITDCGFEHPSEGWCFVLNL